MATDGDRLLVCVEYSAHGFGVVHDATQMTIAEAERRVDDWNSYAETVGGYASIVPVKEKKASPQ